MATCVSFDSKHYLKYFWTSWVLWNCIAVIVQNKALEEIKVVAQVQALKVVKAAVDVKKLRVGQRSVEV